MKYFKKQLITFLSLLLIFALFTTTTYANNITPSNEPYTITVEIQQLSQTTTRSITTTTGSHSTEKFGAQTIGNATFNEFLLGVQINSSSVKNTLTCSPDGVLE